MSIARGLSIALAVALAGCSTVEKPKPTPLAPFNAELAVREAWRVNLGDVRFPLVPGVHGDAVTLGASDGTLVALDAATGRERWRASAGARISAGVGTDGRFTSVVTVDNELVTLEAGQVKWRERLNSRVTTPPLVAGERVFVMGVDRIVHAFDALDGRRLWTFQRPGESLTLAQAGVVAPFKNTLLVGQGARLAGVDPLRGTLRWEVPLATPRGTNEVERLADLVGPVLRVGDTVCARAFQSAVACADAARATLLWSKPVGGLRALGGDAELVFGADATDRISAWRTASGDVAWTADALLHRGLSAPVALGKAVVFGDGEGYLHFLSRDDGRTMQRLATDGSAIRGPLLQVGGTVVAVTASGGVHGFRVD